MAAKGVNVPFGLPAKSVDEAVAAAKTIGDEEVVIKSQILAGGRGLGTFTNGFQGGVHVIKSSEVATYADKMLGQTLVIENIGGAGGTIGSARVAAAAPDGYTLLAGSMGSHVAAPVLTPSIPPPVIHSSIPSLTIFAPTIWLSTTSRPYLREICMNTLFSGLDTAELSSICSNCAEPPASILSRPVYVARISTSLPATSRSTTAYSSTDSVLREL